MYLSVRPTHIQLQDSSFSQVYMHGDSCFFRAFPTSYRPNGTLQFQYPGMALGGIPRSCWCFLLFCECFSFDQFYRKLLPASECSLSPLYIHRSSCSISDLCYTPIRLYTNQWACYHLPFWYVSGVSSISQRTTARFCKPSSLHRKDIFPLRTDIYYLLVTVCT